MFRNDALMWGAAGTMKMLARINATKTMPAAAPACSHLFSFMFSPLSGPLLPGASAWRIRLPRYPWKGGISGNPVYLVRKLGFCGDTPSADTQESGRLGHPSTRCDLLVDRSHGRGRVEIVVQTRPDPLEGGVAWSRRPPRVEAP